jgi:hypothetical protein
VIILTCQGVTQHITAERQIGDVADVVFSFLAAWAPPAPGPEVVPGTSAKLQLI